MSQIHQNPAPAAPTLPASSRTLRARLSAYARLAKLDVFDLYLSALVVWTLLSPSERLQGRSLLTLALFGVGEVCVVAAGCSFDDVTGYRDGSDAVNYGPDAPLRRLARKPLLSGTLSPSEAVRFGWTAAAAGAAAWTAAIAASPHHQAWAITVVGLCFVVVLQYSWGMKLSYHGMQEIGLGGVGMGIILAPFGLISHHSISLALVEAFIFGLGPVLFGVYANTSDILGDATAGRRTAAAILSARANRAFIAGVSASETVVIFGSALIGVAPWWFPVAMLPVIVLRYRQFATGVKRGNILAARKLGMRIHRTAVTLLVVVNLAYPLVVRRVS